MNPEAPLKKLVQEIIAGTLGRELPAAYRSLALDSVDEHGRTPLMVAAVVGNEGAVATLIRSGARVDAVGYSNLTALHEASAQGEVEVARLLMAAGASIDAESSDGVTPLMCAAAWGHIEMVRLLLAHGADRNRHDHSGSTAADIANEKGEDAAAQLIESS